MQNLKTKIFLDSGNPEDTKAVIDKLHLSGQTTNPSLVTKNPGIQALLERGEKLTHEKLMAEYKKIVTEIREVMPEGSISIEVYADKDTTAEEMITGGRELNTWIEGAHIKLPTITQGLEAAEVLVKEGVSVNMTLVFTQEQAAAVYAATRGAGKGQVFVSPFEGRLFDNNIDGMDVINNISKMLHEKGDGHVETLAASIRNIAQLQYIFFFETDIATVPFKVLSEWIESGMELAHETKSKDEFLNDYDFLKEQAEPGVVDVDYKDLDLEADWRSFDISHFLTDQGLEKFAADWNTIIDKS